MGRGEKTNVLKISCSVARTGLQYFEAYAIYRMLAPVGVEPRCMTRGGSSRRNYFLFVRGLPVLSA